MRKQKIRLVFSAVDTAQQCRMGRGGIVDEPRVMTGGDIIGALFFGPAQERAEFEVAIARHARIGRAAVQVVLGKRLDHGVGELLAQIEQGMRNAQMLSDFLGAAMIRTNPRPLLALPHAQRDADDLMPLLHQQRRGHRTIDPAAHGDDDFLLAL